MIKDIIVTCISWDKYVLLKSFKPVIKDEVLQHVYYFIQGGANGHISEAKAYMGRN